MRIAARCRGRDTCQYLTLPLYTRKVYLHKGGGVGGGEEGDGHHNVIAVLD